MTSVQQPVLPFALRCQRMHQPLVGSEISAACRYIWFETKPARNFIKSASKILPLNKVAAVPR